MRKKVTRVSEREVICNSLIGKTEDEASLLAASSGYALRVTRQDTEQFMGTAEFRSDRIKVEIDNGLVTSVRIG
jgi:hypothetical protein